MTAGVNFALILTPLRGPASVLHQFVFSPGLYHILQPLSESSCTRVMYPRVISPRQPPSMVLEVYVLARTIFKFPKIQSRDTSPADRSLRFQVMMGRGLMVRDIILFRNQFSASLALFWNPDFC